MDVNCYAISIQPFLIPSHSIPGVLVATPNNRSSPIDSSVSSIFSRKGKLLLSTEPSLVVREELGVDVIEDRVVTGVVVVTDVE